MFCFSHQFACKDTHFFKITPQLLNKITKRSAFAAKCGNAGDLFIHTTSKTCYSSYSCYSAA